MKGENRINGGQDRIEGNSLLLHDCHGNVLYDYICNLYRIAYLLNEGG